VLPVVRSSPSYISNTSKKRKVSNTLFNYHEMKQVLYQPWLQYFKQATEGLNDSRLKRVISKSVNLCGCEVTVLKSKLIGGSGGGSTTATKSDRAASKRTNSQKKIVDAQLKGIVLEETSKTYHILTREDKIVYVPKDGTIIRLHVNEDNELITATCYDICR
jgi:hypothetical protein